MVILGSCEGEDLLKGKRGWIGGQHVSECSSLSNVLMFVSFETVLVTHFVI